MADNAIASDVGALAALEAGAAPAVAAAAAAAMGPLPGAKQAKGLVLHSKYIASIMNPVNPKIIEVRRNANKSPQEQVYLICTGAWAGSVVYGTVDIGKSFQMPIDQLTAPQMAARTHVGPEELRAYADGRPTLHCWPLQNPVLFNRPVSLESKPGVVKWRLLSCAEMARIRQRQPATDEERRVLLYQLMADSKMLTKPRKRRRESDAVVLAAAPEPAAAVAVAAAAAAAGA